MGRHRTSAVTAPVANGGEAYQRFLDILDSKAEQTRLKYIVDFNYYLNFLEKNPSSLVTKRMLDNLKEIRKVQQQIISYLNHLKKQKLSYSTISGRLHAIAKFYIANEIMLNLKYISQFLPQHKSVRRDEAYTQQEIQKMIEVADERDRVMIFLLTGTGIRVGALCDLKLRNLTKRQPEGYPPNTNLYQITIYEGERAEYYTFTTFECGKALNEYLAYRERFGEKLTPDSPLLREKFNSTVPGGAIINKPKVLNVKSYQSQIDRLLRSSGLRTGTKKEEKYLHKNMATHACRKFYNSQMLKAKVDFSVKEYLLGHRKSRGLDIHYDRTPWEGRLKEYLPAIELLTINEENRLRKQVAEKDLTIKHKLLEKDMQIQQLTKQMINLQQTQQQEIENWKRTQKELQELLQDGGAELRKKLLEEEN